MPSFGSHSRTYSWPPSLHHVSHLPHIRQAHQAVGKQVEYNRPEPSEETSHDMDEDPFSHFISPATNADDDYHNPMMTTPVSATVHDTESVGLKRDRFCANLARRWAGSIKAKRNIMSWQRQTNRSDHERMARSECLSGDIEIRQPGWAKERQSPSIPSIVVTQWDEPDSDRIQSLLMEAKRLRRRRRTTRTLSGHRHSWQEPSPDLYTVLEEGRDHDVAVESASDGDYMDTDDDEELNSEDEALYAEDDDDFEAGWLADPSTRPPDRARL